MRDYISREAALEAFEKVEDLYDPEYGNKRYTPDDVEEIINDVPAADVRPVRWIPVTERLPRKGVYVLCACRANIYSVMKWDGIDWCENTHDSIFQNNWIVSTCPVICCSIFCADCCGNMDHLLDL